MRLKQTYVQDIEEESVGIRKAAPVRRGTGSKRSRAAEVHNLSERVSKSTPKTDDDTDVGDYGIFIVGDCFWRCRSVFNVGCFANRGEGIGSMKRCVHYKNSFQTATRYFFSL